MNAIPLPDLKPGSPEWMKRMTASKVAAVLGLSPWESRYSLWHRMAGLIDPQVQTDEMSRGHYLEPAVAAWFADQHPEYVVQAGGAWAHPERDWQAASPDRRLLTDVPRKGYSRNLVDAALLEIKSETYAHAPDWGPSGTDEVPPYVRCQVVWQLDVLGLPFAHVAAILPSLEFREYRIDYNEVEAAYIRAEARDFLDSLPGGPNEQRPNLDEHAETYAAVRRLHPDIDPVDHEVPAELAVEFAMSRNWLKAAEVRYATALARLADDMGNAKAAVYIGPDNKRIKLADRRAKNGGTPYVQAAAKLPEIEEAS